MFQFYRFLDLPIVCFGYLAYGLCIRRQVSTLKFRRLAWCRKWWVSSSKPHRCKSKTLKWEDSMNIKIAVQLLAYYLFHIYTQFISIYFFPLCLSQEFYCTYNLLSKTYYFKSLWKKKNGIPCLSGLVVFIFIGSRFWYEFFILCYYTLLNILPIMLLSHGHFKYMAKYWISFYNYHSLYFLSSMQLLLHIYDIIHIVTFFQKTFILSILFWNILFHTCQKLIKSSSLLQETY